MVVRSGIFRWRHRTGVLSNKRVSLSRRVKGQVVRNDAERLAIQWGVPIAIALVAVSVRLLFSANRITVLGIIRGVVVGLFVGSTVNLYLSDFSGLGDGTRGAIVAISAVLAEDIIIGLFAVGKRIREQPEAILSIIFRGKK